MYDSSNILLNNSSVLTVIPSQQLLDQSLHVVAPNKQFNSWKTQDHAESFDQMQRIAKVWKDNDITDQHLIYGKIKSDPFHWEMIPYQRCRTCIGRIIQQLVVLWRTVFGGFQITVDTVKKQLENYNSLLSKPVASIEPSRVSTPGDDSFCKEDTIDRQWVITGKKVNVLYNYAPIGFGGERLHFLVVPKAHREGFSEVTQEEYCESLELTTKLVEHVTKTRSEVLNAYLLNKTGLDAGQTVKHWHLHVIFTTNAAQDFWGKLTVIKNILLGSSPMSRDDLAKRVNELRTEFAAI